MQPCNAWHWNIADDPLHRLDGTPLDAGSKMRSARCLDGLVVVPSVRAGHLRASQLRRLATLSSLCASLDLKIRLAVLIIVTLPARSRPKEAKASRKFEAIFHRVWIAADRKPFDARPA